MAQKILAIDLYSGNYYPGFTLPLAEMKANGFRMAIIKASMGGGLDFAWVGGKQFDTVKFFTDYFRSNGFDVALYHWVDPIAPAQQQIVRFAEACKKFGITIGFGDCQQWWSDWYKYDLAGQPHNVDYIPMSGVPVLPPEKIINSIKLFANAPELQFLKQLEIYTYATYMLDRAKLNYWPFFKTHPWIASYPLLKAENIICETWEEFLNWLPNGSPISFSARRDFPNGLPAGLPPDSWSFWQVQSRIWLPKAKGHYDLSVFNGTEDDYNKWIGKSDTVPPAAPVAFDTAPDEIKFKTLKKTAQKSGEVDADGNITNGVL